MKILILLLHNSSMTYSKENYPTGTDIHMQPGLYINIETMNFENRGTDKISQDFNIVFQFVVSCDEILSVCYARFENQSGHSSHGTGNTSDLIALGQASSPEKGTTLLTLQYIFKLLICTLKAKKE